MKPSPADIRYLQLGLSDAMYAKMLCDHHPEFTEISAKVVALYRDINTLALRNEGMPLPSGLHSPGKAHARGFPGKFPST